MRRDLTRYTLCMEHFDVEWGVAKKPCSRESISSDELAKVMMDPHSHSFSSVVILDCRFDHEFKEIISGEPKTFAGSVILNLFSTR